MGSCEDTSRSSTRGWKACEATPRVSPRAGVVLKDAASPLVRLTSLSLYADRLASIRAYDDMAVVSATVCFLAFVQMIHREPRVSGV